MLHTPDTRRSVTATSPSLNLVFWVGGLLIVAAPLIRGGNRGAALIGLEWLSLVVLLGVTISWAQGERAAWGAGRRRWGLLLLAGAPLWVALWQLMPLPPSIWGALPGRTFYGDVLNQLGLNAPAWRAASLTPDATWVAVLAGLPVVACLTLGLCATREQLKTLTRLWIAAAVLQALWGLAQLAPSQWLHFGSAFKGVIGSFGNSNHLASFLVMTLPMVLLELRRALHGDRTRVKEGHAGWLWGLVLFVLVLAVVAGQSRTGLATAVVASLGALLLLPGSAGQRVALRRRLGALGLVLLVALATVGTQGLRRFEGAVLATDASMRQQTFDATWAATQMFWPVGSGLGSFAAVYPRFQPADLGSMFVEHAHSDYVQLLMETGVLGLLLCALALALLLGQAQKMGRKLGSQEGLRNEEQTLLAAGLGLLALLLHAWVDFNLRIPALAMMGAFLFGVFMRQLPDAVGQNRNTVPRQPQTRRN